MIEIAYQITTRNFISLLSNGFSAGIYQKFLVINLWRKAQMICLHNEISTHLIRKYDHGTATQMP